MKTHQLQQGSAEWHAHRASHFNASDAPAMLGCSPYKTRQQLLHELHTGYRPEADAATQRRFDDGHRYEALARPLAEQIIGEDLAPVVGTEGELSASFDGLTMLGDVAWEHKALNDSLRYDWDEGNGAHLPKHYRVQMEQQLLVSGAERVLFMATRWEGDQCVERKHCWYASDPALRAEILAGWKQFAANLDAYTPPTAAVEKVVAEAVEALPAPVVTVTGQLTLQDNFKVFEERLRRFLDTQLIREPKTDQDFADLDAQIKAMKGAEAALDAAEGQMLAQIQSVDQAKKTKDMLAKLVRDNRLMAEKLLAGEKERRRGEIVAGGVSALRDHIASLNKRLGGQFMSQVPADFGGVIKGLKSLASMEDKVSTELARAKMAASEIADRMQVNLRAIDAAGQAGLFPDRAAVALKSVEDCAATIAARLAAEQKRLDDERERIRKEEADRIEREQAEQRRREEEAQRRAAAPTPAPAAAPAIVAAPNVLPLQQRAAAPATPAGPPTLKLGDICARLGSTMTAEFVRSMGIEPEATEKAAKLYTQAQFQTLCDSLVAHIRTAAAKHDQPQAA